MAIGEIDMSRKIKAFFSFLVAGAVLLAMFFFVVPLLLLILAVAGLIAFVSVLLGRGRINITTIRITNTPHVNRGQDIRVSPAGPHEIGRGRGLHNPEADFTIYPDGSTSEDSAKKD